MAERTRNFATIVYEESAPPNWRRTLSEMLIPCFVSPLHDKDTTPQGEEKKAHWHIMFMFDSVKTIEQARECCEAIGGVGCEKINSQRAYARYLCHLDNVDKHQYSVEDVTSFGGADFSKFVERDGDKVQLLKDLFSFIRDNEFKHYCDLLDCVLELKPELFTACVANAYAVETYLKSIKFKSGMYATKK